MRTIVINKNGFLKNGGVALDCPVKTRTVEGVSDYCHIQCAWFSEDEHHIGRCQATVIGRIVGEVTE